MEQKEERAGSAAQEDKSCKETLMLVNKIIEHDDGRATIEFDLTAEEVQQLLSYAIENILLYQLENSGNKLSNLSKIQQDD